jgi:alkylation response protein AidB-like acyl-CoA dehydrogenase
MRTLTRLARGESIGADASVTKLMWSELERELYEVAMEVLGPYATAPGSVIDDVDRWRTRYWFSRAGTIYAGTSEIQRNIVSERVLGLPKGA